MDNGSSSDFFNAIIDTCQNIFSLIFWIFVFACAILSIFRIRKRSLKYTTAKIDEFKRNGKYIPGIFVELNDSKEMLRYFIYGSRWKKRIIKKYNLIYKNYYGDLLREANSNKEICFHLDSWLGMADIEDAIDKALEFHQKLQNHEIKFKEGYAESLPLFEIVSWPYERALSEIQTYARAINRSYAVITGSAGNGKTNLLCSIAELAEKLGYAVLFLNARDIKGDIFEDILNSLSVQESFAKHKRIFFNILNFVLKYKNKKFIILIDAINENENDNFGENIQNFINFMADFSQTKIIVSCRSEYYQERFARYLSDNIIQKKLEYDIKNTPYPDTAKDRLVRKYSEHFNYIGIVSDNVLAVLYEHLLLLRMFFEVYKGSNEDVLHIQKNELFDTYIKHVNKTTALNIEKMLNEVADSMLLHMNFDSVDKEILSNFSEKDLLKTYDETVLLNRKLTFHPGTIASSTKEVVYFVFDELRDYYVAKRIMQIHSTETTIDGDGVINKLQSLRNEKATCEEGVMNYSYIFFRTYESIAQDERDYYCKRILDFYRLPDGYRFSYYKRHNRRDMVNYGLKIVLTSGLPLNEYEKNFIVDCLQRCPEEDGHNIFIYACNGTLTGAVFDLNTYIDLLFRMNNLKQLCEALITMVSDGLDVYNFPFDLVRNHHSIIEKYPERALQIQKVAEMFMLLFKINAEEKDYEFRDYFNSLPGHNEVRERMKHRIINLQKGGK